MSESDHLETFCNKLSGNFTLISTYHTNLNALLPTLSNQYSLANYYNLTTGLASDTSKDLMTNVLVHRRRQQENLQLLHKFFLSTLETHPNTFWWSTDPIPKKIGKFKQRLLIKWVKFIVRSSMLSSSLTPYYLIWIRLGFDTYYSSLSPLPSPTRSGSLSIRGEHLYVMMGLYLESRRYETSTRQSIIQVLNILKTLLSPLRF
ncbi:hypothetical protein Bca4012_083164 [Brassica carinata]